MLVNVTHVAAGIIYNLDQTQLLLSRRKPEQHQGGLWEFPGGKIEPDEDQADALARELQEELGIRPCQSSLFMDVRHDYTDKSVHLWFWSVTDFIGVPRGREQQEWRWCEINELHKLAFPVANQPVVERLLASFK